MFARHDQNGALSGAEGYGYAAVFILGRGLLGGPSQG